MELTHAGGVVFSRDGERILYLIISSSNGKHWVFPKGHIEPGETPQQTVLRELKEETGVVGEIVAELPKQNFKVESKLIYVQYFLIRLLTSVESIENRSLKWVDEKTALQLLSFDNSRKVLTSAMRIINSSK